MPLRFDLGPFEQLYIGKSVLTNEGDRTTFIVHGLTPILRARDVLAPERAVKAMEKLYRCVQQMYLEEDDQKYRASYTTLMVRAVSDCPTSGTDVMTADQMIKSGHHYRALRVLKKLIRQEAFPLGHNIALA
jgi:flagellar biosynthesis repressor protein FlbT